MSNLARRDRGHVANLGQGELQKPAAGDRPKNAIDLLPADLQEQARFFFGFYSETLRGTYGIATRLRFWMKHNGLTAAEAIEAMKNLMSPDRSMEIDTAPKAIAALSAEVSVILRDRATRQATAKINAVAGEILTPAEAEKREATRLVAAGLFGLGGAK